MKKASLVLAAVLCLTLILSGCDRSAYAAADQIIIKPKDAAQYIGAANTVIVDMQKEEDYRAGHLPGAVNIQQSQIVVNLPVESMLAPAGKIASVMGAAGISNDTLVVIYDEGKSLNASRLWWTLLVYGHENTKVISGGVPAIKAAKLELTAEETVITPAEFKTADNKAQYLAAIKDVRAQVDDPDPNTVLLDVRRDDEYQASGKIPGSVMFDHTKNFYVDGMFLDTQATRINYIEAGIRAENTIITYCRSSMRAAATFLRLYDAGYRNLKLYDGAFLEWSASGENPLEMPSGLSIDSSGRDNS